MVSSVCGFLSIVSLVCSFLSVYGLLRLRFPHCSVFTMQFPQYMSQLLSAGRWFSPGTPVSSARKLISSSLIHRLDMTLVVAEALTPIHQKTSVYSFISMLFPQYVVSQYSFLSIRFSQNAVYFNVWFPQHAVPSVCCLLSMLSLQYVVSSVWLPQYPVSLQYSFLTTSHSSHMFFIHFLPTKQF